MPSVNTKHKGSGVLWGHGCSIEASLSPGDQEPKRLAPKVSGLDHQLKVVHSPDSPKVSEESGTSPWKGRNPCRKGNTSLDTGEGDLRGGMLSHQHHSCFHLGRMVLLELKM